MLHYFIIMLTNSDSSAAPAGAPAADPPPAQSVNTGDLDFNANLAQTEEEEQAYDFVKYRNVKFTNMFGSIAHIIKGALGAGVLSGHVAYMKSGVVVGVVFTIFNGILVFTSLNMLVQSAQILYRRTKIPLMSYPEIAEASFAITPKLRRYSKVFRYFVDTFIALDLFGSCACYQILIAKTIKQLVEDVQVTSIDSSMPGYPGLRVYLAIMIIPLILVCLIRHLKYLAPFSSFGNAVVLLCVVVTVYYSTKANPTFTGMVAATTAYGFFEFQGVNVFGMSCIGVIIPIENNMRDPSKFTIVLLIGMIFITMSTLIISFFGYAGYLENSEAPITVNFPMTLLPKIIKGLIGVMVYVTHALNFWVPFSIVFHYIRKRIKKNHTLWELFYRALFVTIISLVAICFPSVSTLMGLIGCLCLTNMAFFWPCLINTIVIHQRPGFGKFRWRLWRNIVITIIAVIIMLAGSVINTKELIEEFFGKPEIPKASGGGGGGGEGGGNGAGSILFAGGSRLGLVLAIILLIYG